MALQKTPLTSSPANTHVPVVSKPTVGKKPSSPQVPGATSKPFWIGLGVSLGWVGAVMVTIAKAGPTHSLGGVALVDWAIGVSAAVSPVAMVWMITAYLQRAADIQTIADPLRRQLTLITGESGAADARIRRFNQAIREQIDLLRSAQSISQDDLEAVMDRVHQHRADLERFENVSTQQVKEIQDVVRRSMFQIEQMMDDKFTMLRVLDGKLQQNGDGVARQVESVGEQITKMLEEIEQTGGQIADALERAQRDSQRLADTSRLQESSLTNAAEAASETLGGLSSKIDLSVARFLERASTAREEAERLAHALDAQTRALDEFSTTLPVRVSEAESVLRGVADRLYASEQLAREQALNLSEKLSQQVDGLQGFMDRFTGRLTEVDAGLDRRQGDLNSLVERVGATTSGFLTSWEQSVADLNDRTGNSLLRFAVVNDETRRNADSVAAHLTETTSKYEDVVIRMRALSNDSSAQMKDMTGEVARQLTQFEALSAASNRAGEEVQARANAALQNLQHVLERVLAAREATQSVGETLVTNINDAVTQNEKMIHRLNETAQLGARAIGAATDNLGRQQTELSGKARASEAALLESVQKLQQQAETAGQGLRTQTTSLMNLLAETQGQLISTDQKLQSFAAQAVAPVQKAMEQIDASATQGLRTLGGFGEGLSVQVERLQDFHTRIGGMSQEIGKATAESAGVFESLGERFASVRASQEEAARQTLAQFSDLSDRLQREVSGLDGQAATAVELLQQAALKVGEQSYQMMEKAQNSGAQIKDVAATLQAEAAQIQSILRQQTLDIGTDLARAEQKFSTIGETIREKADAAYALLDRTAAHYSEVAGTLDQTVDTAQGKVEKLHAALARQADQIGSDAIKIERHAGEISVSSTGAVENLSTLNDAMASTHEKSVEHSQQVLNKLDETTALFQIRTSTLNEAAESATDAVMKAGAAFGEQTGRLVDGGHQLDTILRQLTQATGALTDQALGIRLSMEEQNKRLLSDLAESVAQLDVTGGKLQHIVASATQGADQASERFTSMTENASTRIGGTAQELRSIAECAEITLGALGVNITQQAASLGVVGDQIGAQQRLLAEANDKQRAQMLDMFDKLGAAHAQASEVAERSISYLSTALHEVSRQLGEVGDQSQTAVGNVKIASMGFSDQSTLLLQNAQAAEQQARAVLQATSALQEQARTLRESLQSESERAGESLNALLGRLTAGGTEVRELGTNTGVVFSTLQRALGEQASELNGSMTQIAERQRTLTTALDAQRESINGLLYRLTSAQDETATTAERTVTRLTESVEQITRNVGTIDTRTQDALSSVQKATAGFSSEAEAIERTARQSEQDAQSIMASASGVHERIVGLQSSMREEGERAGAAFDSLLGKVTTGASTLRDISASTETALISLGNTVAQQSATLTASMQQIGERQQSLGLALDAQRDVVNSLLNRLVSAQDETASAAERAASRLTEGTQTITQRIENIDARTQGALISVQAATAAFAKEADAIDAEAKLVEQQAQAIVASATGLHGQIYDLRTSMQYDGERTTEALNGLLSRVTAGSGEIRDAGATAEQTLTSLQRALGEKAGDLNTSMQQIGERQRTLTADLKAQNETIDGLLTRFTAAQDDTAASAERAAARLNEGAQSISTSIDLIGAQASTTLASVQASVSGFAEQAVAFNLQSQQTEKQARDVMSATAGQSTLLLQNAQAAEQQARAVLQATSALQEQARTLRESLQSESERAGESLNALLGRLTAGGTEVRELGTNTGVVFSTLQRALGEQASELNGSMTQIAERQRTLTTALDAQRESINGLLYRLTSAQDETATTAERTVTRLTESVEQITRNVGTIDTRTQDALSSVQKATAGFSSEAEAIERTARQSEQDAQSIMASASGVHERIVGLQSSMREEGERAGAAFDSLLGKVTTGASTLRDISASTETALISLGNTVAQQSATLTASMQQIGERQQSLGLALDAQRDVVNSLLNRLVSAQDETASAAERAASRLTEGTQTITQRIENIDARTQGALISVQAATAAFAKEADAIDAEAKLVEQQAQAIVASATGLHGQIYDLRTSMQYDGERTTEALNGLLSRVTAGSGEIRDAGATAEQTLTSLQRALGEKAGDLNTSMQQIGERQRTLTADLKAQNETIDGLLTRFTAAQDDTAASAERAAARLNEGAQSISTSIDLIGAQASTTLASVQASVSGFAEQAVAFNLQSQQTEKQARDVMSATAGIQEQAQHMREAMQVETARVVDMLSTVIGQLDSAGRQLKTQSGEAVQALDQTTLRFTSVTETGTDLLRKQSEVLAQAIDQSEARLSNAGEKVRGHLRIVGEIGDKAEAQAQQLANAAEFATTRLVSLRDTFDVSEKSGRNVLDVASSHIEEVKATLQGQLQLLSESSQKAVDQVAGAAQTLATQSDALRANLASSESALTEAAELVREEAKHLPTTFSRSVSDIETATKTLKGQAEEADKALIGTADRFISVTASARNNMVEEMKRVSGIADDAGKILTGFNQLLAEQVSSMQQSTAMLSSEQRDLVEKASLGVESLSEVGQRLSSLRSEATATAERLVREFDALDQRAATTGGRLAQAGEGIAKQVDAITEATARAETQLSGTGATLRDQLDRIRGGLQAQIDDISRGLIQITAQLERTGASLRSTTVGAVADVERVGQRFEQTSTTASAQVNAGTDKMRKATEEVASLLAGFGSKFDQMLDHMAQAGADIKHQEGSALGNLQNMLTHLGMVAEKLESARTMSGDVSHHAIERLDEVVTAVQSQMNSMASGAQTAAGIMRGIGQIYTDQTGALTKGVGEAHSQVMIMNKSIDDMQQRTDRMRAALKLQGEDLMNSLRQILTQLETTGDGLTDAVNNTLQQQAAAGVQKIS